MFLALVVVSALGASPDVAHVHQVFDAIEADANGQFGNLEATFTQALQASVERAAARSGLEGLTQREWVQLKHAANLRVRARLDQIPATPADERRAALEALGREVTTSGGALEIIDEWLGLAPPSRATATINARELPPLSTTLKVQAQDGSLQAVLEQTKLLDEVGRRDDPNQVIDLGEWVSLRVAVLNASRRAWFSTTAFPTADGSCAVVRDAPALVGEMLPGDTADVELWIYISSECTREGWVELQFRDTHRREEAQNRVRLAIRPVPLAPPVVAGEYFDSDRLGWSDGSLRKELGPGLSYEYSLDLGVPGEHVASVQMDWVIPRALVPFFASQEFQVRPLIRDDAGVFRASDDLDLTVVEDDDFHRLFLDGRNKHPGLGLTEPRMWIAADIRVRVEPVRAETLRMPVVTPAAASSSGMAKQRPVATPLGSDEISALVRRYMKILPRAVEPSLPDSVGAISGYELIFDEAGFKAAWAALTTPPTQPPSVPAPASLDYAFRLYRSLPVQYVRKEPVPTPKPPAPPPAAQPRPAREAFGAATARLDLRAGAGFYGVTPPPHDQSLWGGRESLIMPSVGARYSYGRQLAGIVSVSGAFASFNPDGKGSVAAHEWIAGAGAGYHLKLDAFEVTPYGLVDLGIRSVNRKVLRSFGGQLGVTGRWRLSERLGAHFDANWRFGPSGPTNGVELMSGSAPTLTGGLSVFF